MSEQTEQTERKMTPEEMERRKSEINKFHKDQIEFLTTQYAYEELLTKIDEVRLRRMVALNRQAQMMAPEPEEAPAPEATPEAPVAQEPAPTMTATRTLKKEENANK
jgi:hypothetical protein